MTSIRLQPPEPFTFTKPDEWLRWKKGFEQFRVASGLNNEAEERQVSTLLYCLGVEADDVLTSTDISNDARRKYDDVINKFDSFFKVRKSVLLQQTTIWYIKCTGALPTPNERHFGRNGGSPMSHGRCFDLWMY